MSDDNTPPFHPDLIPGSPPQRSWLTFEEITALRADPWDFHRNDDREQAAARILELDDGPGFWAMIHELTDDCVPIYTSDLFAWAARPRNADYLVGEHIPVTNDIRLALARASSEYWYHVLVEAHRALIARGVLCEGRE